MFSRSPIGICSHLLFPLPARSISFERCSISTDQCSISIPWVRGCPYFFYHLLLIPIVVSLPRPCYSLIDHHKVNRVDSKLRLPLCSTPEQSSLNWLDFSSLLNFFSWSLQECPYPTHRRPCEVDSVNFCLPLRAIMARALIIASLLFGSWVNCFLSNMFWLIKQH